MKITHIIYSMGVGGAQTMLVDIVNEQCKTDEVQLVIVNESNDSLLKEISPRVRVDRICRPRGSKNPFYILKLNFILFQQKPEVIHAHDASLVKLIPFFRGVKRILTVHDTGLDGSDYPKFNQLIAISEAVYSDVKARTGIESVIVCNGIVVEKIKFRNHRKNSDNKVFKIVQVSRLSVHKKGQDILIKAVSRLIHKGYDIQLDFIGEGESSCVLKELVKEEGITNNVNFLGLKDRMYIYNTLCEYDLFVQPSRQEGFGLTVAEAMAAGVPVLVSNIEGPIEITNYGEYGFLFKTEDYLDCANNIESIIVGDAKIDSLKVREYVKAKYDISNMVNKYREIYASA